MLVASILSKMEAVSSRNISCIYISMGFNSLKDLSCNFIFMFIVSVRD